MSVPDEEESEAEDTEGEVEGQTVESSTDSVQNVPSLQVSQEQLQVSTSGLEPSKSRASTVAATRGLNIAVGTTKAERRRSRLHGLPLSPRPSHSSGSTPTSTQESSPHQL